MMLVVASDAHRNHNSLEIHNGEMIPSSECAARADYIFAALCSAGWSFVEPDPIDLDLVTRVHTPDYVEFLSTAWERWAARESGSAAMGFMWPARGFDAPRPDDLIGQLGYHSFAADTSIVAGTWTAAASAAAIATTAADRLVDDGATTYGLCRPPGHHASSDQFGGYCYLNNAALAAQRLVDRGCEAVAILDIDYHHGNGTQSIFYERSDVYVASIHADPIDEFPWFAGHASETGRGDGDGANLNLPLRRGASRTTWFEALDAACAAVSERAADAMVVSLGLDTFVDDPLGTFSLTTHDFATAAERIGELGLATVVVQEGGYAVDALGTNAAAFLAALL